MELTTSPPDCSKRQQSSNRVVGARLLPLAAHGVVAKKTGKKFVPDPRVRRSVRKSLRIEGLITAALVLT
jgi:hypothetical protein